MVWLLNSILMEHTYLSCTVSTMDVDDLVLQGARASAAMILT